MRLVSAVTIVTMSASYGAGGSAIGPRVAERLGVPFVDRAVPVAVARELDISVEEASAVEENSSSRLWSVLAGLAPLGNGMTAFVPPEQGPSESELIAHTEMQIRRLADDGGGVLLGRAAAVVLADHPDAVHIRLDGAPAGRIEAAMRQHDIDRDAASAAQKTNDKVRSGYVTHHYGVDPADPSSYHLVLDTTRLDWETTEELIVAAVQRVGQASPASTPDQPA